MIKNNRSSDYPWNQNEYNLNCASYALNCDFWYCPDCDYWDNEDIVQELAEDNYETKDILSIVLEYSVEQILKDFDSEIRILDSEDDLRDDEEKVAFRIGIHKYEFTDDYIETDYDFHFRVFRNGRWMEKCGSEEIRTAAEDVYAPWIDSSIYYGSELVMFAHKIAKWNLTFN